MLLAVGDVYEPLRDKFVDAALRLKVGHRLDETVQMGPVISARHKELVLGYIATGLEEGAKLILDGRGVNVEEYPSGYVIGPTIFDEVSPEMSIDNEETFGPVDSIIGVEDLDEAIDVIHANPYGNASSIFTSSGK